jgi:hypothetical protein
VLEQVERYNDAERWIASLIASEVPRSDALLDLAIEHFHWDERRVGPSSLVGARVLVRREDVRFLRTLNGVGSPFQGVWAALSKPPSRWRLVANRLTPDLGRKVGAFLAVVRGQRPGLAVSLNAEALAWWDNHLSRPRLGPLAILGLTIAPVVLALAGMITDPSRSNVVDAVTAAAALAVGVGTVALVRLYAVAWPRLLWRRRWAAMAPGWVRLGWAPAAIVPLALAATIPPSAAAAFALATLALLPMFWATTVGEPDTRQLGQPIPQFRWRGPIISFPVAFVVHQFYWGLLRLGVRFPWRVRSLYAFFYLAIFWLVAVRSLPGRAAEQMTLPLIAAAVAFVGGAGTLDAEWRALSQRRRGLAIATLGGLFMVAVAALWFARTTTALQPVAAALVSAAVLLHKAPAAQLAGVGAAVRDRAMRFGAPLLLWLMPQARSLAPVLGLLAIGVFGGLIIVAERMTDRDAPPRQRAGEAAAILARFGWIGVVPLLILLGLQLRGTPMFAAGLWLLTGVGATVTALMPPSRKRAPGR